MKKSGIALILGLFLILLCGLIGFILLKNNKIVLQEEENIDSLKKYGVVSNTSISGDNLLPYRVNGDYYIVDFDNKCGVVNSNNDVLIPFEYSNCNFVNDLFIGEKDNNTFVLNMKNDVLFETDKNLNYVNDVYTNEFYYFISKNGKTDIYDSSFKLLKTINEMGYIDFFDKYIIANEYIYQFDTQDKIKFDIFYYCGDYFVFETSNKKGVEVYNAKTKELVHYDQKEQNEYSITFIDKDSKLIIDYEGNVLDDGNKQKILDKYYLDYSSCQSGFSLLDLKDNKLTDKCYSSYFYEYLEYGALLLHSYEAGNYDLVTPSGKIVSLEIEDVMVSGKHISATDMETQENYFYDLEGNKVEEVCTFGVSTIANNRYTCYTAIAQYIVDDKRNIINGPYESLFCNENGVCVFQTYEAKYGVLLNDEVIVEPSFITGVIDEDIVVLSDRNTNYVLKFNKSEKLLNKENLVFEDDEESFGEIVVEDIISEYSLEDIEDDIKANEELFKKYAFTVLNNSGITNYKKEVLSMFNVIVDQKSILDEEYFFDGLRQLSIKEVDELASEQYAGIYQNADKSIEIKVPTHSVLVHELMHFFDYNVSNNYGGNIYVCGDEYYSIYDVREFDLQKQSKCEVYYYGDINSFIKEAGAEVHSYRYAGGMMDSYTDATVIYHALAYLYGEEFMESVFFDKEGDYKLFKKITNYISPEEYIEFMNAAHSFVDLHSEYDKNDSKIVAETLITLYEKTIGGNWYEDEEFLFTINFIVNIYNIDDYDIDFNYLINYSDLLEQVLTEYRGEYSERVTISGIVLKDEKTYLNIPVWHNNKAGFLKIVYDFENKKITEFIGFYPEKI